jgi:hypothetical protein
MAKAKAKPSILDDIDTAPIPDVTQIELPSREAPAADSALGEEDRRQQALGHLVDAPGWSTFVERIQKRMLKLKTLEGVDISKLTREQVGERFIVGQLAAGVIEEELKAVQSIGDAIKRHHTEENHGTNTEA